MNEIQQAINDAMYAFGYMLASERMADTGKCADFYSDVVPDSFLRGYVTAELAIQRDTEGPF